MNVWESLPNGSSTQVILVNEADEPIGTEEKMQAHKDGLLHRAISVFIFDSAGRMLIQRRADHKYHSGGHWSNACCSHPAPDETAIDAAHRRLYQELGIKSNLKYIGALRYRASLNGLIEYEFDHVFVGRYDGQVYSNPAEVAAWQWVTPLVLSKALATHPAQYTPWFHALFGHVVDVWNTLTGVQIEWTAPSELPSPPGLEEATILPAMPQ